MKDVAQRLERDVHAEQPAERKQSTTVRAGLVIRAGTPSKVADTIP